MTLRLPARENAVDFDWLGTRMLERPATPPGSFEGVEIKKRTIPAGERQEVVSLRNAIFMGYAPTSIAFDVDVDVRSLGYEGGEWMADTAQEVWQMHEPLEDLAERVEPEVLIGGLGLGVFTHLAAQYSGAITTTIERDPRVIKLVYRHVAARNIVEADLYAFARDEVEPGQFDVAFLDTWQRTGESCWIEEVVPLRRLLAEKIPTIYCWNEAEMLGQIHLTGVRSMVVPEQSIPATSIHWRVLKGAAKRAGFEIDDAQIATIRDTSERWTAVEDAAQQLEAAGARRVLERLTRDPGSEEWEEEFGELWDRAAAICEAWKKERGFDD